MQIYYLFLFISHYFAVKNGKIKFRRLLHKIYWLHSEYYIIILTRCSVFVWQMFKDFKLDWDMIRFSLIIFLRIKLPNRPLLQQISRLSLQTSSFRSFQSVVCKSTSSIFNHCQNSFSMLFQHKKTLLGNILHNHLSIWRVSCNKGISRVFIAGLSQLLHFTCDWNRLSLYVCHI